MLNKLESTKESLEKEANDNSKLRDRNSRLKDRNLELDKEVRKLRVKALRAPDQRSRAVNAATLRATREAKVQPTTPRIKRPDGRIENWVRELCCQLIAVRHVPASQTPGVISDVLRAIKPPTNGNEGTDDDPGDVDKFSDRSARRFTLEGHVMGKILVAKEFKAAPG